MGSWLLLEYLYPERVISRYVERKAQKQAAFRDLFYLSIPCYVRRSLARLAAFLHRIGSKIWVELNYIGRLFTFLGRVRNVDDSLTLNNNCKHVTVYYDKAFFFLYYYYDTSHVIKVSYLEMKRFLVGYLVSNDDLLKDAGIRINTKPVVVAQRSCLELK